MKPGLWRQFMCWIGMHGPNWYGNEHGRCDQSFQRVCPYCGERWWGDEIEVGHGARTRRTLGDWQTKKQLQANGLWIGKP